jgi:hypothetical protein
MLARPAQNRAVAAAKTASQSPTLNAMPPNAHLSKNTKMRLDFDYQGLWKVLAETKAPRGADEKSSKWWSLAEASRTLTARDYTLTQ